MEQILDKHKIPFVQMEFPTHKEGDVEQITVDHVDQDEHQIFKTLVLTGKIPVLLLVSSQLTNTWTKRSWPKCPATKSQHGAIEGFIKDDRLPTRCQHPHWHLGKFHYPIYVDQEAKDMGDIIVSSGQIGRSVKVDAQQMVDLIGGKFADIKE